MTMTSMPGAASEPRTGQEVALLAGGCFWCLEAVYDEVQGVISVESGYAGGHVRNPSYREVCAETTGHAEVVRVTFDPAVISFGEILEIFFSIHDPTTPNRQGHDVGSQYRSAIFTLSPEQERIAQEKIAQFQPLWGRPIVTEVTAAGAFYMAEEYHQEYFARNPSQAYCQAVVAPKVAKFRKAYKARLKA